MQSHIQLHEESQALALDVESQAVVPANPRSDVLACPVKTPGQAEVYKREKPLEDCDGAKGFLGCHPGATGVNHGWKASRGSSGPPSTVKPDSS